jgi:lysyl-tRNA synthetase class 1
MVCGFVMTKKIIGHGTWYDKTAVDIVERERKLGRSLDLIRTEMGIGISGIPHIGHLGDAARSYSVTLALKEQGYKSELEKFQLDFQSRLRNIWVIQFEIYLTHILATKALQNT